MNEDSEPDPNELRLVGNQHFLNGKLNEAYQCYDLAVEILRSGPSELPEELTIHLCNRSACSLKMGNFESAQEDAIEAVSLSQGKFELRPKCDSNKLNTNIKLKDGGFF